MRTGIARGGGCTALPYGRRSPCCATFPIFLSLFRFPADAGSHGVEFVFDVLITAIKVVDALDGRGPLGGEPGEHERGAGAEIRGHDRSPGKALDAAQIDALAKLPGREQLLGQLLGTMNAVPTNFVSLFANLLRGLLYALKGIEEQKGKAA